MYINIYIYIYMCTGLDLRLYSDKGILVESQTADMSAVSHTRHCCCVTSRHVCCVTQQTCLICHIADMSAVSHNRQVFFVTQQTCLLCHTADITAASHSRRDCCVTVTQPAPMLCHTSDMSALSQAHLYFKANNECRRMAKERERPRWRRPG